jgi:hypothetical protein
MKISQKRAIFCSPIYTRKNIFIKKIPNVFGLKKPKKKSTTHSN